MPNFNFIRLVYNLRSLQVELACNPRGFRECELLENIAHFKPVLNNVLERCAEKVRVFDLNFSKTFVISHLALLIFLKNFFELYSSAFR